MNSETYDTYISFLDFWNLNATLLLAIGVFSCYECLDFNLILTKMVKFQIQSHK